MADYDDIALPVKGQPISSTGFGVKARNAIIDLGRRMGIREAAEQLPSSVSVQGNGINSITAAINTWQTMPSFPASVNITNPSTTFNLVCFVFFGAWMQIATSGTIRMGINVTGGVTADPDPGVNSPVGWGLVPMTSSAGSDQHSGMFQLTIPPNVAAVNLNAQGMRSAANAAQVNYPSINVIPWRYETP
jgi:hypothetical protein